MSFEYPEKIHSNDVGKLVAEIGEARFQMVTLNKMRIDNVIYTWKSPATKDDKFWGWIKKG